MTAMGIAMVVAVFVMTLAIAQGFRATLVASGSPQNAIVLRKGATSETVSARAPLGAAADRSAAAGRARRLTAIRWRRPSSSSSSRCRGVTNNQPANVPVRGVGPRAFEVREHTQVRRGAPASRRARARSTSARLAAQRFTGLTLGSDVKIRRRDLEGRRHLRRRRCVVRVGGVGRHRSDDAGVSARRLSVGHREAGRSVGVRIVRRGDRRRPAARAEGASRARLLRGAVARDDDRRSACSARSSR